MPTEVPPVWGWFQTPLRLEVVDGKIEIVPSENERPVVIKVAPSVKKLVVVVEVRAEKKEIEIKAKGNAEKPFMKAMAKMAKLKEKRSGQAAFSGNLRLLRETKRDSHNESGVQQMDHGLL